MHAVGHVPLLIILNDMTSSLTARSFFFSFICSSFSVAGNSVTITVGGKWQLQAERAIVAVPLTVFQQELIAFTPPLSCDKQAVIHAERVSSAVKVCCRFANAVWPSDMSALYSTNGVLRQFWPDTRAPCNNSASSSSQGDSLHLSSSPDGHGRYVAREDVANLGKLDCKVDEEHCHLVLSFGSADIADEATMLSDCDLVTQLLGHFDEMFQ